MAEGILNPIEQLEAEFDFDVYTKQEVDALLDEKADKSDTYTKTETDALLDDKADTDAVYTKTETDTLLSAKADKSTTLAGYGITDAYTKTQTDNLLSAKANADSVYTKAEIDTELTVTKDGTWVKGTQTTATNLQKLEGGLEYAYAILSKQYDQLKKYINGNYYDYDTDTNTKYTKSVPNGAMPYASLDSIGGKTVVWNQLVDSGTTTVATISGHKYYTLIDGTASIVTADGTAITIVDDTADMVCDLTLMYGSGNEPTTVAEFQQTFPAQYYAFNNGTLLSAGVTEVVSKDSNDTTLQTVSIPAEVQALEGYGWSAGQVYNYIDFERKKFVKNVGRIVLDGTTSGKKAEGIYGNGTIYTNLITDIYDDGSGEKQRMVNVKADKLLGTFYLNIVNVPYGIAQNTGKRLIMNLPNITTTTDANTWLSNNNVNAYYELETPIEVDISQYLTDDNLISVEAGGTLTFENSNGDDYRINVPSAETYMVDLQEAI